MSEDENPVLGAVRWYVVVGEVVLQQYVIPGKWVTVPTVHSPAMRNAAPAAKEE